MHFYRPTWVEVSPAAYKQNLIALKDFVGPNVRFLAVLKADGYGHGANLLAPVAVDAGAAMLGVSSLEEGIALRESGIQHPILLLAGIYPLENFSVALDYDFTPTVASLEAAQQLVRIAASRSKKVSFHLKVDTGMGRIGVSVEAAKRILEIIRNEPSLQLSGVYTHLASGDSDLEFTKLQREKFLDVVSVVRQMSYSSVWFHLGNSAGALRGPDFHFDMVRLGLATYGCAPIKTSSVKLEPVMSWQTKAIFLKKVAAGSTISYGRTFTTKRESDIITVPVGYADGVSRRLSNKGFVLVKGRRCSIVGVVTMDHIMIDVTGLGVEVGAPVVLIGRQGAEEIKVEDWAAWADTVPYEIFCGISKRVPRINK